MVCKRYCKKFGVKKPTGMGRYEAGQVHCQTCDIWMDYRGCNLKDGSTAKKDSLGLYCKCCNYRVRARPRNKVYKEKLRENLKEKGVSFFKLSAISVPSFELKIGSKHYKTKPITIPLRKNKTIPQTTTATEIDKTQWNEPDVVLKEEKKPKQKKPKTRSRVNKSSDTVVTNPRRKSKRDRLAREAKSKSRWNEEKKQKKVNKIRDQLELLRAKLKASEKIREEKHLHDKKLQCIYCSTSFRTTNQLKRHVSMHTRKKELKDDEDNEKVFGVSTVEKVSEAKNNSFTRLGLSKILVSQLNAISQSRFFKNFSELNENEKSKVEREHKRHSKPIQQELPQKEIRQDINKLLEKEPELIETLSRNMVGDYLYNKRLIKKDLKIKLIDEYLVHKSLAKIYKLHSNSTEEIRQHLVTSLRLPKELREMEAEGSLHHNPECSIKIALFATDHFNWDGQKNREKQAVSLAIAISQYLKIDEELNQIFQGKERTEEITTKSKKRDEIHEKYRVEYLSSWKPGDRTRPQYLALYGHKNLEVVEFLCKWEHNFKNRIPIDLASALISDPEKTMKEYKEA